MKPVYQEIFGKGKGDCFSACLASLLELPLSDVPKFRRDQGTEMMSAVRRWLAENFNLSCITVQMKDPNDDDFSGEDFRIVGAAEGTLCIAAGRSPNLPDASHAVVGQLEENGLNFILTHDPHPSGKGIVGFPTHLYFLVPLNPAWSGNKRNSVKSNTVV